MRIVDRALSIVLILGAAGHTLGVIRYYRGQPDALFWALSATVLMLMLAAIKLLRSRRRADRGLAWVATMATVAYLGVTIGFGRLVGNMTDPRVIGFAAVCIGLILFGIRDALGPREAA